MPNAEFLEKYPLYRKFEFKFEVDILSKVNKVNINMDCPICKDIRTFNMNNEYNTFLDGRPTKNVQFGSVLMYGGYTLIPKYGIITWLNYKCASCNNFERDFFIEMNSEKEFLRKVGQVPPWDITIERELNSILGDFMKYYKNGLISESQGYGIGAYAYYRRIIEGIIDFLLDQIGNLLEKENEEEYKEALVKTKETNNTQEKIKLVYDLLPPILNPQEFNPLKTIYGVLSEGIHGRSDEDCLTDAEILRETTLFLVKEVLRSKEERKQFTEKMRKLLKSQKKVS